MNEYKDFVNNIKKASSTRKHKISNSYGVRDAFNYYRNIRPQFDSYVLHDVQYYSIIREVNKLVVQEFLKNGYFNLPVGFGSLILESYDNKPKIVAGKLKYNASVDWGKTYKLWYDDKEAFENKTLVKISPGTVYRMRFKKGKKFFKNRAYYDISFNRTIKGILKDKIKNKEDLITFNDKVLL